MNVFDLFATISIDTGDYKRGLDEAEKENSNFEKSTISAFHSSDTLTNALKNAGNVSETLKNKISVLATQYDEAQDKVNELEEAFNRSVEANGNASNETRELAKKLSEAEKEAANLGAGLDELTGATADAGDKAQETGGKFFGLADKLKTGLANAAKVGTAALGAASAAVAALTKTSIEGYAEYEQLVGGVETLFKNNADTVMNYANSAYKTSGLSANEYMETVTSFSASLLQSLGGDTEAAAQYADTAVTDMSDNANKMGTDMEMIQNAYQGFAKQNYTMLDNLKLGYGGTKEEMERLLSDAEKLSGQKFDISSYADIVDAIHIVQTEMGITGTTAKEAATTIQGSVSAAKSAWQNLVTGIADENADLDGLIGNFVDSVSTAGENVIPRVEQILVGIGTTIEKLSPIIAEQIPPLIESVLPSLLSAGASLLAGLGNGILTAAPGLIEASAPIIVSLVEGVISALPTLVSSAVTIVTTLANGIAEQLPTLIPVAFDAIFQLADSLTDPDTLGNLLNAALEIILALANGLMEAIPELLEKGPKIVQNIVTAIIESAPKLLAAATELIAALGIGLVEAIIELPKYIGEVLMAIVNGFLDGVDRIKEAGSQLLAGLWNGITDKIEWLKGKVSGVVNTIKSWFTGKDGFDEHSPSRWGEQVGDYVMIGVGNGFTRRKGAAIGAAMASVGAIKEALEKSTLPQSAAAFGRSAAQAIANGMSEETPSILQNAEDIINSVKSKFDELSNYMAEKSNVADLEYQLWERTDGIGASDAEKYVRKLEMLNSQQENQKSVVEAAEAAYRAVAEQYGEASAESHEYKKALLEEKLALQDIIDKIREVSNAKARAFVEWAKTDLTMAFPTARVEFRDSAVGVSTAAAINAASAQPAPIVNLRAQMVTADGKVMAEYIADPLTDYMDANGTPILNPIT